jgi:hypothetical protein
LEAAVTQKIVSLTGGPVPDAALEPNAGAIKALEYVLERARAGEVIGVGVIALHADRLSSWRVGGLVGSHSMVGAATMLQAHLVQLTGGD